MGVLSDALRGDGDPFEVEPVPLEVFLYDRGYLGQPRLSAIQFDALRHLEAIYLPADEDALCEAHGVPKVRKVHLGVLQWGKGSGKDFICGLLLARWVYRLLCLRSPARYYGKAPQTHIHFLNIALSASQASRAFFASFRDLVKSAPVFRGRFDLGTRGEPGMYEIRFEKNIHAISGHSGSASQEGLNLLGSIADEISEFKTDEEVRAVNRVPIGTADGIVKLMRSSGRTRFPDSFKAVFISYPRFLGDAIQRLTERGLRDIRRNGESSQWYVSGPHATWEVNPTVGGREVFASDYQEDASSAEAMYECRPQRSTNVVYKNQEAVRQAFSRVCEVPPIEVRYRWGRDVEEEYIEPGEGLSSIEGWQADFEVNVVPYRGAVYAIHGDLAVKGDRAGVAMSHVCRWEERVWLGQVRELRPIVKVDFVFAFEADLGASPAPREVQIRWFRKLVWLLSSRGFQIGWVSMDGFQSLDSVQILRSRGIEAKVLSCDRRETPVWRTLHDVMYEGRVDGPYHPGLLEELVSLRVLPSGKVDHPSGGSKDLADALAGSVYGALQVAGVGEGSDPVEVGAGAEDWFGSSTVVGSSSAPSWLGVAGAPTWLDAGAPSWLR